MADDDPIFAVLKQVAKSVNTKHKLEVAVPGTEEVRGDVKNWVPTASVLLNLLLGEEHLGMATGRITELFGDYSHGKSTVAQIMMNGVQAAGGVSVMLDAESTWNRERAVDMGHNAHRHLAVEVDTAEMGFEVIDSTVEQFQKTLGGRVPIIFVWDTIAASPTAGEKKGDEYEGGMMWKPRLIRRELKRLNTTLDSIQGHLLFVNQTIEGPKPNRTGVKTTPGGGGIKFWSSQRLQIKKVGQYSEYGDSKDKLAGITSEVKTVKNKLKPPFKSIDLPIHFKNGLDPIREVTNYHLDNTSLYNISGAYKKIVGFTEKDISFYEKDIRGVFEEHEGLLEWMKEQVISHWLTGDTF